MTEVIQFQGYAPDLPPETQGIFTECANIIPMTDGYAAQGSPLSAGVTALAGPSRGFAVTHRLDNTRRTFAATQTKIYELSGTAWTDRSQVGNYDVGADAEGRVRFAQFGNVTVAAVGHSKRIQTSATSAFADAGAGAPRAKIVETANNFVFAFNYVDDTHGIGTAENGWWCSALGNEASWTPSVATQCVAGKFMESPGPITAARRLGASVIAFKESSAFIGQYVGAPNAWDWRQLSGDIGTFCQESCVSIGTALYFISADGFQMFDGSRIAPIGVPVRNKFFSELSQQNRTRIFHAHDRRNTLIYWFYPSNSGGGAVDKCLVYNYKTDRWGRSDVIAQAAAEYIESGVNFDGLGALYSTYDDLPTAISYDSSYWSAATAVLSYFNASNVMTAFNGTPANSSITTGHYGDIKQFTTVDRVMPRFLVTPTYSDMKYSYSDLNADSMTELLTSVMENNVYDMLWTARWHKFKFDYVGAMKITGISGDFVVGGYE